MFLRAINANKHRRGCTTLKLTISMFFESTDKSCRESVDNSFCKLISQLSYFITPPHWASMGLSQFDQFSLQPHVCEPASRNTRSMHSMSLKSLGQENNMALRWMCFVISRMESISLIDSTSRLEIEMAYKCQWDPINHRMEYGWHTGMCSLTNRSWLASFDGIALARRNDWGCSIYDRNNREVGCQDRHVSGNVGMQLSAVKVFQLRHPWSAGNQLIDRGRSLAFKYRSTTEQRV